MSRPWLHTDIGVNFAAIGLAAIVFAIPLILFRDISCLVVGRWPQWALRHEVESAICAGIASLFSFANLYFFRPGAPKAVTLILAVSFGSYVFQWYIPVHDQLLIFLCVARIVAFSSLALLLWNDQREQKSER